MYYIIIKYKNIKMQFVRQKLNQSTIIYANNEINY